MSMTYNRSLSRSGPYFPPQDAIPASSVEVEGSRETLCSMDRRKKLTLGCLLGGSVVNFLCLAILAPFYPGEALSRGINQFLSSWVFSVYALTQFILSPLMGKAIPVVGAKFIYIMGAFVTGTCTILFGCLDWFPRDDPTLFIVFSFLIRIVMAVGGSAWLTSTFAIAMFTFRGNAATVMGLIETAIGIGMVLGPALGGVLYQAGGFILPFLIVGILVFLFIPVCAWMLESTNERMESGSLLAVLSTLWSWIIALIITSAAMLLIVLQPILEIHLEDFGLTPLKVGMVFFLCSLTYAISASVAGIIVEKINNSRPQILLGFIGLFIAYFFMGPSPLSGLFKYQALWLNIVCVALVGLGAGQAVVPTYSLLMKAASDAGMPDNLSTHGAVSGLWTSSFALGETVGPVIAGWLTEDYGFGWATTVFSLLPALVAIVLLLYMIWDRYQSTKCLPQTEKSPLLSESNM